MEVCRCTTAMVTRARLLLLTVPVAWFAHINAVTAQDAEPTILPPVEVGADSTGSNTLGFVPQQTTAGTKTDTPILKIPQSISVIPESQIRQQNAQTLNQVLQYTPGVQIETRGGVATRYDQLTIRGFNADYYLNGQKLLTNNWYVLPQLDPFLMERIDVIRGPSVLYGQASAGGLIDQVSKAPLTTPYHELGVELGNFHHYQMTFDFSGPIDSEGRWLYRIAGIGRIEDGQVYTTQNERVAVAPSLTFRPDADTSLTLTGIYQYDPKSTSYGSIPPVGTVLFNPLGTLPRNFYDGDTNFEKFNRTQMSLGYNFSKRFIDTITLRSRGLWFRTNQSYASVYGQALDTDFRTLNRGTALSRDTAEQASFDTSVEAVVTSGPVHHTLLAGFDYQHLNSHWTSGFGTAPTLNIFAPIYNLPVQLPAITQTKANLNQYGLYVQDQAQFGNWVLTLSGRLDSAETFQSNAIVETRNDQWNSAFSGRAGLTYVFDNGIAPYFSYADSFTPIIGTSVSGAAFQPERGRQYEVGVKYQPPGSATLLTVAAFNLERSNLVTPDLINPTLSVQSGSARSQGVEVEMRTTVVRGLDLLTSYSYLDTTYLKDNSGLQGKRFAAIPMHQAAGWAYYTMPEGSMADGLSFGGGVRFTGSTFNSGNSFVVQSFTLVDAALNYDVGRQVPSLRGASLYLNARNLLDAKYVASCYYGNWCAYGYGRQVMGGLRYQW